MPPTTKTYTYNGSEITNTGVGIKFTDGTISPKNWEQVWSDDYKKSKGIFCLPLYPELKNSEINLILNALKFSLKKLQIW